MKEWLIGLRRPFKGRKRKCAERLIDAVEKGKELRGGGYGGERRGGGTIHECEKIAIISKCVGGYRS